MPTKRTRKGRADRSGGSETAEHMLDRVLGAFDRWVAQREPDPDQRHEVADVVRTACELKGSVLGEPNPADWDAQLAAEVVGQVVPRKVLGVDEQYVAALVPGMLTFIEFLVQTGRWKPHNDAAATRRALTALEPELAGRFNDPGRLSMGGRLIQLALHEGVDVTDPESLAGFTQRFNEMPVEWRKRLTDEPDAPDGPFGDADIDAQGPWDDEDHEGPFDSPEVWEDLQTAIFTGATAIGFTGELVPITVPTAATELAALLDTPLLTRISVLVEWAGAGQKVTSTGAMRRGDAAHWASKFGVVMPPGSTTPNSMWDLPELATPWRIAAGLRLIAIATTKVYAGIDVDSFTDGDTATRVGYARDAVKLLLDELIAPDDDELSDLDAAVIGLLLPVLASLCRPGGVDLSPLETLADPVVASTPMSLSDAVSRILYRIVLNIVDMLQAWGLVSTAAGKAAVRAALRPAVAQAIDTPGAPFSFRLKTGAVPVDPRDAPSG